MEYHIRIKMNILIQLVIFVGRLGVHKKEYLIKLYCMGLMKLCLSLS